MKKLTAGVFAAILTVVGVGAANAEIASKQYVDDLGTTVTNNYTTLNGKIESETTARENADSALGARIDGVAKDLSEHETTAGSTYATKTELSEAVAGVNGDTGLGGRLTTLENTVSNQTSGLAATKTIADRADSQANTNKSAIEAINNAETGILKQAQNYADTAEADAISAAATDAKTKADAAQAAAIADTATKLASYTTTTDMNTLLDKKEDKNNKKTVIDSDTIADGEAYPNAKAVSDFVLLTVGDESVPSKYEADDDKVKAMITDENGYVVPGLIDHDRLGVSAVEAANIAADAVETAKIKNGAVTYEKLDPTVIGADGKSRILPSPVDACLGDGAECALVIKAGKVQWEVIARGTDNL